MSVQITPLHDRVLVRRVEEKATVKGGSSSLIRQKKNLRKAK